MLLPGGNTTCVVFNRGITSKNRTVYGDKKMLFRQCTWEYRYRDCILVFRTSETTKWVSNRYGFFCLPILTFDFWKITIWLQHEEMNKEAFFFFFFLKINLLLNCQFYLIYVFLVDLSGLSKDFATHPAFQQEQQFLIRWNRLVLLVSSNNFCLPRLSIGFPAFATIHF